MGTVPAVSGALAASTGLPAGLASEATNYLGQGSPAISGGPLVARNIGAAPYAAPTAAPTYPPTTHEDSSGSGWLLGLIPLCLLCCCCLLALAALAAFMMSKKKKKTKKKVASGSSWDEEIPVHSVAVCRAATDDVASA